MLLEMIQYGVGGRGEMMMQVKEGPIPGGRKEGLCVQWMPYSGWEPGQLLCSNRREGVNPRAICRSVNASDSRCCRTFSSDCFRFLREVGTKVFRREWRAGEKGLEAQGES